MCERDPFQAKDNHVSDVRFDGGCDGNLQALCKLVEGMPVQEVIEKLRGIECQNGTSCPDQLAAALTKALSAEKPEPGNETYRRV